jgi:hypothetical protein
VGWPLTSSKQAHLLVPAWRSGSEEAATILTWIQKQLETYLPEEAAAK